MTMPMPTRDYSLNQLGALIWLKWRLFRNALRSRRGAANRIVSIVGTLAALLLALIIAAGLGVLAYTVSTEGLHAQGTARASSADQMATQFVFFGMLSILYLMWATVPLSFGGGSRFNPEQLLLYPVSLRKLFVLDLLSELTSLASIFAVPSVFAIALGAGLATGQYARSSLIALCATAFGLALAKLLSTSIGALMRVRRSRGEALLAIFGVLGALSGVLIGQGAQLVARYRTFPAALRWTPPGIVADALTNGLRRDGLTIYLIAFALLLAYTLTATLFTYRIALRMVLGTGGAGKRRAARATSGQTLASAQGWQLPFVSAQLSSVLEKELRYAMRNAQLRAMGVMPLVMTFSFKLMGTRQGTNGFGHGAMPFVDGVRPALSIFYVYMILAGLACNLFAYDGAGMRTLVLAPIERQKILMGKNLSMLCVSLVFAVAVTVVNELLYRDLSWRALLFVALCFIYFASVFASIGNWFSMRFPKRLQIGKRMNASGVAGFLLLPVFIMIASLPAAAVLAGYLTRSLFIEYAILIMFAGAGVVNYFSQIGRQGRALAERELDILEAVTGRSE